MSLGIVKNYINNFYYTALSSDISDNKITGTQKNSRVYITDTDTWYQVNSDYTLSLLVSNTGALATGNNVIGATKDAGPSQTLTRTYTASADMTTASAITAAPSSGKKIVATDIFVSTDTAMSFTVQMETSNNVLAKVYLPGPGSAQISLRGYLKGDAADKKLFGKASVAGNVSVTAIYFSEA